MFVVVARYVVTSGHEETVADLLRQNAAASEEPGCLEFTVHQHIDDSRAILLYERYVDEAAFRAHRETAHFADIIVAQVVPLLDQRDVTQLVPAP